MDTLQRLMEITSRLEHLETAAEFIARETVHVDNALSQTGTLISVLADDVREKVYQLVQDLERIQEQETETFH